MPPTSAIDKVFEQTSVPLTLADARSPDFPLIRVNRAFCALSGYAKSDVVGKNCRFLQGSDRDQPGRRELSRSLEQGKDTQVVLRNFTRLGDSFDNLLFIHHIRDMDGQLIYVMGSQFAIEDRSSAQDLDRHLVAMEEGVSDLASMHMRIQLTVRRQLSSSMAAMLDSAILYERLTGQARRGTL